MSHAGPTPPTRLAVTLGDPRGIGAEVLGSALESLLGADPSVQVTLFGASAGLAPFEGRVSTVATGTFDGSIESAGTISVRAIRDAVRMIRQGDADALVTGPIHKPALHAAGLMVPGHTEFLQELTDSGTVGMLMHAEGTDESGPLRILLATTHLPLRDVPQALTRSLLEAQVRLLWRSLRERWGIAGPRIALCALNPHASDGGLFGSEEADDMRPAAETLRSEGMDVTDPLPADTVFLRLVDRSADAVVAPYHDVGMAVFKTLSFGRGVNVTLGLPFPRTSPDHGTAFDLVGRGIASSRSSLEALRLAVSLARRTGAEPL